MDWPGSSFPLLAGWLLFFPNAPYVVTDFIHLGRLNADLPLPLDFAVFLVAALAGRLLGFASLAFLQRIVVERAGCGWSRAFTLAALLLSSFGVYLGRVRRWNSWDAVASLQALLADIARVGDPSAAPARLGRHSRPRALAIGRVRGRARGRSPRLAAYADLLATSPGQMRSAGRGGAGGGSS